MYQAVFSVTSSTGILIKAVDVPVLSVSLLATEFASITTAQGGSFTFVDMSVDVFIRAATTFTFSSEKQVMITDLAEVSKGLATACRTANTGNQNISSFPFYVLVCRRACIILSHATSLRAPISMA